ISVKQGGPAKKLIAADPVSYFIGGSVPWECRGHVGRGVDNAELIAKEAAFVVQRQSLDVPGRQFERRRQGIEQISRHVGASSEGRGTQQAKTQEAARKENCTCHGRLTLVFRDAERAWCEDRSLRLINLTCRV